MDLVALLILVLIALGVSGIFLWGIWSILRTPRRIRKERAQLKKVFSLQRHPHNPILHTTNYDFEKQAVLNPAAVHDGKRTHLFYRAIGADGVSRVGYANSEDGVHMDERLPYPVFALEGADPHLNAQRRQHALMHYPELVASGGSWGGTEDPRAVLLNDRVYLSFSAFHNWDSVRIGMTSIALSDLQAKRWKWSRPSFLSPKNQVHKNWLLFPEKVKGKFAILHSISPKVEIAYCNDVEEVGRREPYIASYEGPRAGFVDFKSGYWHNRMRGPGAPPLRTPFGWLLFYHAMQHNEPEKYKLGAMLLDSEDPTKVLARSPVPVLEPQAHYETSGAKPGIVYVCGATTYNDKLTVYYGAADNYICAASASLSDFVMRLFMHKPAQLRASYI